jgi:hypothetical protein
MGLLDALRLTPSPALAARIQAPTAPITPTKAPSSATATTATTSPTSPTAVAAPAQGPAKPAASPGSAKAVEKAKADFEKAWKETLGFAGALKDVPTKLELAQALKACDAKRKEANAVAASDPDKHVALMQAAMADMQAARDAADHRSESKARKEAEGLRGDIEKTYKANYDLHAKMVAEQEKKKAAVDAATGAAKAKLAADKEQFDKQVEAAEHKRDQAQADLEAVDNPLGERKEFAAIVARHKAGANVVEYTEVDKHENEGLKPGEKHVTTTTTSVNDGTAKVETTDSKRKIGLDGVTQTDSKEREFVKGGQTLRSSEETTTKVGPGGVSREKTDKSELERADGKKLSVEQTRGTEIGKEGYRKTDTRTVTQTDGSSKATSTTKSVERGEGKVGLAGDKQVTTTDASGTATTKGASAKGGLTDGGGYASGKGNVSRQGKGGMKAGAVGGLSASASCVIGDPAGDPPRWPVTTKVTVGASLAVSGGHDKKGGTSKGSVELEASKEFVFEQTHQMFADELTGYLDALKAADKGGVVDKTYKELQVLSVGLSLGWDKARDIIGGKASVANSVGKRAGESAAASDTTAVGGKLDLNVKAVKVGVSVKETRSESTKATRNEKGGLDVEGGTGKGSSREGTVGVGMGLVEGSVGRSHSLETSLGYKITIEPGDDADELLKGFQSCKSSDDQKAFVDKHKGRIKITGRNSGRKEKQGEKVELGVAGVKLRLGSEHGTEERDETDADGKVVKRSVKGSTKSGGDIGIGSAVIGDSGTDEATATSDGDGNAELDLTTTKAQSNLRKMGRKVLGRDVETGEKKKGSGLIATVAGKKQDEEEAQEEVQDHDVSGLKVRGADLKKIHVIAKSDQGRWTACAIRKQDYFEWRDIGKAIASGSGAPADVAAALARFVGNGSSSRMEVVENLIRPRGGDVSMGARADFPESLKKLKAPYQKYVVEACEQQIAETAKQDPAAAGKLGQQLFDELGKLLTAISGSKDFTHPAAQAEMISAINARKTLVQKAMRKNAGQADGDAQAEQDEYARLLAECESYAKIQATPLARIREMVGTRQTIMVNRDFAEASKLIKQIDELYAIWTRDWAKAETIGKKIGKPGSHYGAYKPKLDDYPKLKRACFM